MREICVCRVRTTRARLLFARDLLGTIIHSFSHSFVRSFVRDRVLCVCVCMCVCALCAFHVCLVGALCVVGVIDSQ